VVVAKKDSLEMIYKIANEISLTGQVKETELLVQTILDAHPGRDGPGLRAIVDLLQVSNLSLSLCGRGQGFWTGSNRRSGDVEGNRR
jgi:hypothetical protein